MKSVVNAVIEMFGLRRAYSDRLHWKVAGYHRKHLHHLFTPKAAKVERDSWRSSWGLYGEKWRHLNAVMITLKNKVRAEIYLGGSNAKAFYWLLERQREAIEKELGYALNWEELPAGQDSRISISLDDADPRNEADWKRQHGWLADRLNDLHRVFAPRLRDLDPADWIAGNPTVETESG